MMFIRFMAGSETVVVHDKKGQWAILGGVHGGGENGHRPLPR
jgi:hypothetical protein